MLSGLNVALQVWPGDDGEEAEILNYMPRRETCARMTLSEAMGDMTREEFFEETARQLENLARLMRAAGADPTLTVYYPDKGMDEAAA